jgi:hypothetical protein
MWTQELTVSLGGVGVDPLVFELVSSKRKFLKERRPPGNFLPSFWQGSCKIA